MMSVAGGITPQIASSANQSTGSATSKSSDEDTPQSFQLLLAAAIDVLGPEIPHNRGAGKPPLRRRHSIASPPSVNLKRKHSMYPLHVKNGGKVKKLSRRPSLPTSGSRQTFPYQHFPPHAHPLHPLPFGIPPLPPSGTASAPLPQQPYPLFPSHAKLQTRSYTVILRTSRIILGKSTNKAESGKLQVRKSENGPEEILKVGDVDDEHAVIRCVSVTNNEKTSGSESTMEVDEGQAENEKKRMNDQFITPKFGSVPLPDAARIRFGELSSAESKSQGMIELTFYEPHSPNFGVPFGFTGNSKMQGANPMIPTPDMLSARRASAPAVMLMESAAAFAAKMQSMNLGMPPMHGLPPFPQHPGTQQDESRRLQPTPPLTPIPTLGGGNSTSPQPQPQTTTNSPPTSSSPVDMENDTTTQAFVKAEPGPEVIKETGMGMNSMSSTGMQLPSTSANGMQMPMIPGMQMLPFNNMPHPFFYSYPPWIPPMFQKGAPYPFPVPQQQPGFMNPVQKKKRRASVASSPGSSSSDEKKHRNKSSDEDGDGSTNDTSE